jgi:hypothetical protein
MKRIYAILLFIIYLVSTVSGATKTNVLTGNWATGLTWGGAVPAPGDSIVIKAGTTVTYNVAGALTISGMTVSGTLLFGSGLIARNLTVNTNVTITGAGNLSANTARANIITIGGNLTNGNILNLNAGGKTVDLIFDKNGNATLSGAGGTNAFHKLTLNMGASNANTLTVNSTKFTAALANFLTLANGTLILSYTTASAITPFSGNVTIGATCGLITSNAAVTVNTTAGNITLAGLLTINLGTVTIGNAVNNSLLSNGGALTINGGILNVAGRYGENGAATATFSMTGGTLNVATAGATTTAGVAPFQLSNAGSSFSISAGTVVIKNTGAGNLGFTNTVTTSTVTGGIIQIGFAGSPAAAATFLLNSSVTIPALFINNTNASASLSTPITVLGNITLTAGKLITNNLNITLGGNWAHTAAATWTPGTCTVTFNGALAETISITAGTEIFNKLILLNAGVKTLGSAVTVNSDITIGAGSSLDVSATNYALSVGGNWLDSGSFNGRAGTVTITSAAAQSITNTNVAGETFNALTLAGAGVKTMGSAVTASGILTLNPGSTLDVSASNFALNVNGNWVDKGTFTCRAGTVTFGGGAQTITKTPGPEVFNTVDIKGTLTKTLGSAIIVGGDVSISGGAILNVGVGNNQITVTGNWTDFGTFTALAGTVIFNNNVALSTQTITDGLGLGETFNLLSLTGSAPKILGGSIVVNSGITIGVGATLDVGAMPNSIIVTGTWTDNGTFLPRSGMVNFNKAGAQTIAKAGGETFNILNLSGGNTKTLGSAVTLNSSLNIAAATTFDVTVTNYAINIAGNWTDQGIFTPRAGTVTFNGTSAQTITKAGAGETFNILSITGTGGVVLGGAITTTKSLTIGTGSSLDVSASNFAVAVKTGWTNNGTFNARAGTVTFSGAAAQTIGGTSTTTFNSITQTNAAGVSITAAQNLAGTLTLTVGNFTTTGQTFTLLSTAANTGRVATLPAASNIIGNINMQRYVIPGATGWYFLGAPISAGLTLQSWQNSFTTSGYTGSSDPSFSFISIYYYNETVPGIKDNGYVAASNSTNAVALGQGFWCYVGPAPLTINTVSGAPGMHNFTFPVTFTASGGALNDGWNLVANPYPSSIDWNLGGWTKTNVSGQIQIWNPNTSTYASWVGGVGVNGGSNILASSQAFWIQTTAAAPSLKITEACKSATDIAFMRTATGQNQNVLKLKVSGNGFWDETAIYLSDSATVHYDTQFDAAKFFSLNTAVPSLSSVVDTVDLSINCIPAINTSTVIPLRVLIGSGTSGTYTISIDTLQNMSVSSCLILEDKLTGSMTDLRAGNSYSFTIADTTQAPRFLIHIGAAIGKQAVATRCAASKDGMAIAHGIGSLPCSYTWKNAKDSVLKADNNITGNDTLSGIAAGIYKISISGNAGACATVNDTVAVGSPAPTAAFGSVTNATCRKNKDGAISITALGGTTPYTYSWSVPGGSSAQNQTGLDTGTYTLTLTDANQCSVKDTFVVTSSSNLQVLFTVSQDTTYMSSGAQETFTNISSGPGSFIWNFGDSSPSDSSVSTAHAYSAPGNFTITLTGSDGTCADSLKHVIVVMPLVTGVHNNTLPDQSVQVKSENGSFFVEFNLSEITQALISVYDAEGQRVTEDLSVRVFQNKIQIPLPGLARGMYFIGVSMNGKFITRKILR